MRTAAPPLLSAVLCAALRRCAACDSRIVHSPNAHAQLPTGAWQIRYEFTVPAEKPASGFNPESDVFFIWGDVDFDPYGSGGGDLRLSDYVYNQIVPQLTIGNSLSKGDAGTGYAPGWQAFDDWVVQAQYFWMKSGDTGLNGTRTAGAPRAPRRGGSSGGGTFALCGDVVPAKAGETVTTVIKHDGAGTVTATIAVAAGTSSITIPRPFPNEPALFRDWAEFFSNASAKSVSRGDGVLSYPDWNVEACLRNKTALCEVCPIHVTRTDVDALEPLTWHTTYPDGCSGCIETDPAPPGPPSTPGPAPPAPYTYALKEAGYDCWSSDGDRKTLSASSVAECAGATFADAGCGAAFEWDTDSAWCGCGEAGTPNADCEAMPASQRVRPSSSVYTVRSK